MTIALDHLTADHLAACAVSLGLPDDAITPRVLRTLARHVDDSPAAGECWPWTGPRQGSGYGIVDVGRTTRGAHRLLHVLVTGPLEDLRLVVRHTCDVPACCQPAHLLRGSQRENVADALKRGRARGRVLDADEREQLVRLADRFARGRRPRLTRPQLFAWMAEVFDVSAGHAGTIIDEARRASRVGHEPARD